MSEHFFVALIKTEQHISFLTNDGVVQGWTSLRDALAYWTNGYKRKHGSSYEGSMSACIHYISFQPRVIEIPGDTEEERLEFLNSQVDLPASLMTFSNVSGRIQGVPLSAEKGPALYETGTSPDLM